MTSPGWFRIEAPYFVAGGEFTATWKITKTAPILNWAKNKGLMDVFSWCNKKGFHIRCVFEKGPVLTNMVYLETKGTLDARARGY